MCCVVKLIELNLNSATLNTEFGFVCAKFLLNSCMKKRKSWILLLLVLVWQSKMIDATQKYFEIKCSQNEIHKYETKRNEITLKRWSGSDCIIRIWL